MDRSGALAKDVEKAEKALQEYQFLFWLDKFTYIRESKTNIDREGESDSDDENAEEIDEDALPGVRDHYESDIESQEIKKQKTAKRSSPSDCKIDKLNRNTPKRSKIAKTEYLEEMEMNLIRDLGKAVKNEKKGIRKLKKSLIILMCTLDLLQWICEHCPNAIILWLSMKYKEFFSNIKCLHSPT